MFLKTLAHCPSSLSEAAASGLSRAELAVAKGHATSGHDGVAAEEACGRLGARMDR